MAPACIPSLGLGVFLAVGCGPAASASVEPDSAVAVAEATPASETASDRRNEAESGREGGGDGGFLLTVESRCRYLWRGQLVRADDAAGGPSVFDVKNSDSHELEVRPGDALVLTSPRGGVMALQFDKITTGYMAHVEVAPDCTSVKRTSARRPGF